MNACLQGSEQSARGPKMKRDVFVTLLHKDVTIVQNWLIDWFYLSMLRKRNCKKIIIHILKYTSHLASANYMWILLWIIMMSAYQCVFAGIRAILAGRKM